MTLNDAEDGRRNLSSMLEAAGVCLPAAEVVGHAGLFRRWPRPSIKAGSL